MFDEITVPRSYLKGLLISKQEKLLKRANNTYQTKCLENALYRYKVHRQKLFIKEGDRWTEVAHTGAVNFYDSVDGDKGDRYWIEFRFFFLDGVIDKKELIKFEIEETAAEIKKRNEESKERDKKREIFKRTFKYKFCSKLFGMLNRLTSWFFDQTIMPSPTQIKLDRDRAAKQKRT